ncbi:MAG: response regulator transcription factor [Bacteroidales bacterium]|jgi:DNA-binding response OmpR family regulator|nr:response regulator transcription factor [Bacteroidales bacterium]
MKLLICDDDPMTLKALEFQFKKDGYTIMKSVNGKEAQQILHDNEDIALLITDICMPMMNGLELVAYVRNTLKSQIPILVLTRVNLEDSVAHAFELGANDYLTKPFCLEEMTARVAHLLNK